MTAVATNVVVANLIRFLETGQPPQDLFASEIFIDVTLPQWRLQADTVAGIVDIRARHPHPNEVRVERVDLTESGFVMQFEERWTAEGQRWYAREIARADVVEDRIVDLAVYCTGDWDEAAQHAHASTVALIRR